MVGGYVVFVCLSLGELGEGFLKLEGEYGELLHVFKRLVDVDGAVGPGKACRNHGEGGLGLQPPVATT